MGKLISSGVLFVILLLGATEKVSAQSLTELEYDIGSPVLSEIWVDPATGSDSNAGDRQSVPLRTVYEAWGRVPRNSILTGSGYRINLRAGVYQGDDLPNYWELRRGTRNFPIILRAVDGNGTVTFRRDINMAHVSYLYLIGINIVPAPAGDGFHCEACDHVLLKSMVISGGDREAHETVKVNQSQYIYIEDSNIHGADDNAIDFVAVQYGHIVRNLIHDAQDWCLYTKGGSAYLRIEGNRIFNCGTGGYTAGQGTGFQYMTSPWLHYEAYDTKFINNVIHDTQGAGFGVNGGYNILLAFNTLYRVGTRSHAIEVVYGERSCDGSDNTDCVARMLLGGWGTAQLNIPEPIGNRNISIYNNVLLNPAGFAGPEQLFAIYGPRTPQGGTTVPSPQITDDNLQIRGNVLWSANANLGVEDSSQGCQGGNLSCNETQLRSENEINTVQPALIAPATGDFRPAAGGNLFSLGSVTIQNFSGGDRVLTPLAPEGLLLNQIDRDRTGAGRDTGTPAGAYSTSDGVVIEPGNPTTDAPPRIRSIRCFPKSVRNGDRITCSATVTDDTGLSRVRVTIAGLATVNLKRMGTVYRKTFTVRGRQPGRYLGRISATDSAQQESSRSLGRFTVRR